MLSVTFADGYVSVSHSPWGDGPPGHGVGPVGDEFADTAVEGVAKLLSSLGHRVVTPEEAQGEWAGRRYHPHPDELADVPAVR